MFNVLDTVGIENAQIFVYEEDKINYMVYDFRDTLNIYEAQKPVEVKLIEDAGIIEKGSSFFLTGAAIGMSDRLCEIISDEIYCWTLDFRNVQPGDRFKVLYEAKYLNEEFVGVGNVKAVYFNHLGDRFLCFSIQRCGFDDYFDQDGNNLRKFFLKTPVKNSLGFHLGFLKIVFIQFKNVGNRIKELIMLQHEERLFGPLLMGLLMLLLTTNLMVIMSR